MPTFTNICEGCGGEAVGKLALRLRCGMKSVPGRAEFQPLWVGWIISAVLSCTACAASTAIGDVASKDEIAEAAKVTLLTYRREPDLFKVCLKPINRVAGEDRPAIVEAPKLSTREQLEKLWSGTGHGTDVAFDPATGDLL